MQTADQPNTRFNTISNPPPELKVVCKWLERECRRERVRTQFDVRSVAKRACREYAKRGQADDLARFLWNQQIILQENPSEPILFDRVRADEVIRASEERRAIPSPKDTATRISRLREELAAAPADDRNQEPDDAAYETVPPDSDSGPIEAEQRATSVEAETAAEEVMADPILLAETERLYAVAMKFLMALPPEDFEGRNPLHEERYELFLTPIESEIWDSIYASVETIDGEERVGVYADDDRLWKMWCSLASRPNVSPKEFRRFFDRFVEAGILSEIEASQNGMVVHRLPIPRSQFHVQKIERRARLPLTERPRALADQILQRFRGQQPLYLEVYDELAKLTSDEDELKNLYWLVLGRTVRYDGCTPHVLYGMFLPRPSNGRMYALPSFSGFGPYVLVPTNETMSVIGEICTTRFAEGKRDMLIRPSLSFRRVINPTDAQLYAEDGSPRDPLHDPEVIRMQSDHDLTQQVLLLEDLQAQIPAWIESSKRELAQREHVRRESARRTAEVRKLNQLAETKRAEAARLQAEAEQIDAQLQQLTRD